MTIPGVPSPSSGEPPSQADPPFAPDDPASPASRTPLLVMVVLAAVLVVAAVAVGGFLIGRSDGSDSEVIASGDSETTTSRRESDSDRGDSDDEDDEKGSETTRATSSTTSTVGASRSGGVLDAAGGAVPPGSQQPAATAPPVNRDPNLLPVGLYCRDLHAQGYSYAAAVEYWMREGMTERMDADLNGIPCETVYPRSDVVAYWPEATFDDYDYYTLPSGLLCADLADMGIGVYEALVYYIWEGYPSRMDADADGIPCETVYPDAEWIWLTEF